MGFESLLGMGMGLRGGDDGGGGLGGLASGVSNLFGSPDESDGWLGGLIGPHAPAIGGVVSGGEFSNIVEQSEQAIEAADGVEDAVDGLGD